jgi:hypothetical protein
VLGQIVGAPDTEEGHGFTEARRVTALVGVSGPESDEGELAPGEIDH